MIYGIVVFFLAMWGFQVWKYREEGCVVGFKTAMPICGELAPYALALFTVFVGVIVGLIVLADYRNRKDVKARRHNKE
ncbi:hypothetical protein ACLVWU_08650 [Bdellovibrio sp. HCB290]|uniref:hypothetical protein n=1 Tax=Bdellovibrio sp. HCB290 TaxID=3394356 RepID=UPI0039B66F3E